MSNTSFTLAYGCVLVAALLPMFCALLAKAGAMPRGGNRDPRAWLAAQSGWRARANAAQANSFEALPFFIGAVVIAHQIGAPQARAGPAGLRVHRPAPGLYRPVCERQGHGAQPGLGPGPGGEHRHPAVGLALRRGFHDWA